MPGWGEGFGIAYLEAMGCGVPVVASKLDASQEAVRNGDLGIIVNPKEPGEIQRGILAALKRARGVVPPGLEYFSAQNFETRVHRIVEELGFVRHVVREKAVSGDCPGVVSRVRGGVL